MVRARVWGIGMRYAVCGVRYAVCGMRRYAVCGVRQYAVCGGMRHAARMQYADAVCGMRAQHGIVGDWRRFDDSSEHSADPMDLDTHSWEAWPMWLEGLFCSWGKFLTPADDVKVTTFCSGTDSPVVALRQLLACAGKGACVHHASVDHDPMAMKFVMANCRPKHFFRKTRDFLMPDSLCSVCNAQCSALHEEVDILTGGFPCKPFSSLNLHRWTPSHDPFATEDAKPFLEISKYLRRARTPPKIVVLENVMGLLREGKSCQSPRPLDFILDGFR